jgi:hypothetical protein
MATVTYNMLELGTGRKFRVTGNSDDSAEALAEANAKLAMTVGTVVSSSQSGPITAGAGAANGGTQYSDAILILTKSGETDRGIKLDNIATSLSDGNGKLNVTDPLITGFAAAYRDGSGNGGYSALSGYFVA